MRPDAQFRRLAVAGLLASLGSIPIVNAQLPGLSQLTQQTTAEETTAAGTTSAAATTGRTTNAATTGTSAATTGTATGTSRTGTATTGTSSAAATTSGTSSFPSNPLSTSTASGTNLGRLTGAPTLAGVGIPTMIVPYTANAPFMKKSDLPEGTVFIAVGAVLAFLGFCVIAWRALVAWSINRSVKRAALASIMASETKNPGGWASNPFKPAGGFYTQAPGGSTLSLGDHSGRGEKSSRRPGGDLRNPIPSTGSGLFFSPTASNVSNATANIPMQGLTSAGNRSSSFLPAGYYASPSSAPAGGASTTTLGGAPPFASPTGGSGHGSPNLQARRMSRPMSNMSLAPQARDGNRLSTGRPVSGLNPQASASSLHVGTGHAEDGGSRAPSAYLEDLFEGHPPPGSMPR